MSSFFRQQHKKKDFQNLFKEIQRRLARRERVSNPLETIEFKHYLRSNNDRILWFTQATNETQAVVTDPNFKNYQLPFEPDGNKLRVWYRFNDFAGGTVKDWSGKENIGTVIGSPQKQDGHVAHMNAMAFGGINNDFIRIPHKVPDTLIANLTTGFSMGLWVKPNVIGLHGGKPRVIACKIDDTFAAQERGWSLWVEPPSGTLYFAVKTGGTVFVRKATNALGIMNQWYFITAGFNVASGGSIPALTVNGAAYTTDTQTLNDKTPWFTTSATINLDTVLGGTGEPGASAWSGSIGDFRYFYEKIYTNGEALIQFTNKYTISDINHIALAGIATTAFEVIGENPPQPGEEPPPPPAPTDPNLSASFSPVSFSSTSFTVSSAPYQPGEGGGGGDVEPTIPDQFLDDFASVPKYTLTTLNQVSSDSKWKLSNSPPGAGGYVRTEDYTAPGDSIARSVMRMKSGGSASTHPLITLNSARFYDISFRCLLRTVSQTTVGATNAPWIVFKYVDANNYYYVVLMTTGVQLSKVVGGTTTVIATQSNPGGNVLFPIGSLHDVKVDSMADGTIIRISVDDHQSAAAILFQEPTYTPQDSVITSLTTAGLRAVNSDIVADSVLIRPIVGDTFQADAPYVINTNGNKSPNNKWETITRAGGTGGTIRTFDQFSAASGGRVLNLNSGTGAGASPAPLVLSTAEWAGVDMRVQHTTISQHVVAEANRAEIIFKYKDANNYYWFQYVPTAFKIKRKIGGVEETLVTNTLDPYPDNQPYPYWGMRILAYNSGKDVQVFSNYGLDYEEHSKSDGWYTDDNGVLSGLGRVGFRAPNCNAVFDNIYIKRI